MWRRVVSEASARPALAWWCWCADPSSPASGGSLLRGAAQGSAAGGRPCCWRAAALLVAARPRSRPNRARSRSGGCGCLQLVMECDSSGAAGLRPGWSWKKGGAAGRGSCPCCGSLEFYSSFYCPALSVLGSHCKTMLATAVLCPDPVREPPSAMADNKADGKRPSSSAEEEAGKRCDVCHGPLKPPVHQLASRRWRFSSQRRVSCSDCGDADVAEEAINIVSLNLGYFKVPCPNEMYGCGGFAFHDTATHAAVCAHAPLTCPKCAFVGSPAQFERHLADPDGPQVWADWPFGALAEAAIDVVAKHLGYFKVPCPNEVYGCGGAASRDAATHAAVCAHAPCACPGCAFLGSPAQLVRHLTDTAGPHAWPVHDFEYGSDLMLDVRMPQEPHQDKHLLVAEDDGGVFLLAVGGGHATVVCVRSNAGSGPVYSSMLAIPNMAGGCWRCRVPSCSTPSEFEVDGGGSSVSVHPGSELHLPIRVCIDRKN